jgi:protein disulfide-isomerase
MKRSVLGVGCRVSRRVIAVLAGALLLCGCNQKATAADQSGIWKSDYDAALKQAAAENKYVLVDFSGSDWCGWCIKLEKEVFSQKEFIDYAKDNLICVLLDFPRGKELPKAQKDANQALLDRYQVQGFPTVLMLNPQGKGIVRDGYQQGGAAKYVEFIKGVIAADQKK